MRRSRPATRPPKESVAAATLADVRAVVDAYRLQLELSPSPATHSDLILYSNYDPRVSQAGLLEEARRWDQRWGVPLMSTWRPHGNSREPERRLRVGYLTNHTFGKHAMLFSVPILPNHDRDRFEPFVYSSSKPWTEFTREDAARFCPATWRFIENLSDEEAAELIRDDAIDVLIDLIGHGGHRAALVARKPSPLIVFWYSYPGSTGMSAVDYRISDRFLDRPGSDTSVYSEHTIWLDTFWIYHPCLTTTVSPLPCRETGQVTFGSLNGGDLKVTTESVAVWAAVLRAVADSRMIVLAQGEARARIAAEFRQFGVSESRVDFVPLLSRKEYFALYHRVDVALDPVFCSGHTTTLDAAWMGVPTISMIGPTICGRAGLSISSNLGLPLAVSTPADYVELAAEITAPEHRERLAALRAGLRQRMAASVLCDAPRYVRRLEEAYRAIWRRYCAGLSPADLPPPPHGP